MSKTKPVAFIVHGRDEESVRVLTNFLSNLGVSVHPVTDLAAKQGGPISLEDIITRGIANADVVIGLLSPDEAVTLYDPSSGKLVPDQSGWQARPNVYFELGLAFGIAREKLVLTSLGDVRPTSDMSGMHVARTPSWCEHGIPQVPMETGRCH